MCKRYLNKGPDGRPDDDFNPKHLMGRPSDEGFLGIPTLSDSIRNFFTFRWLDKIVFGR